MPVNGDYDGLITGASALRSDALLFMLGEELKRQLSTTLLLTETSDNIAIRIQTQRSLRTIDNMLLYRSLYAGQTQLDLSPVHVGAVLTRVAAELSELTQNRKCETEIYIQPGITTIDSNALVFEAGLVSLWQSVLHMTSRPSPLRWNVFRTAKGIRVSVTNNSLQLDNVSLGKMKSTAGLSSQPIQGLAGPTTDMVVADGIFDMLGGKIRKVRSSGEHGFGVTFARSLQLSLI